MPAASDEDDLDARGMCAAQGLQIAIRDGKLGIEERAIDIDGKKTDYTSHFVNSSIQEIGSLSSTEVTS
jgi:hypothetical protein